MKKIINGKVYDTSTAQAVCTWDNGVYGDINSVEETLYLKRTGEYFLLGEGGARTQYATACGDNSWAGGSMIIPLSWEAAREWAEEHMTSEDYEAAFGAVTEDDSKTAVNLDDVRRCDRAGQAGRSPGGHEPEQLYRVFAVSKIARYLVGILVVNDKI